MIHDMEADTFDVEHGDLILSTGSKQVARFVKGYWVAVGSDINADQESDV